jgi:hypothetical protein
MGWSADSSTFGRGCGTQCAGYVNKVGLMNKYEFVSFFEKIVGGNAGSLVGVAISASLLPPVVNSVCNAF